MAPAETGADGAFPRGARGDDGGAMPARPAVLLVIDDERAVREGLARLLALPGRRDVHLAATCGEALEAARRVVPDVVLLDVDLAGDDGLALLPVLRALASVVVLTSHVDPATRARALALGAHAFVGKGEPAALLVRHVASCEWNRMREGH